MLDTANTYDDKVALVRLLVVEDAGRVANVLKKNDQVCSLEQLYRLLELQMAEQTAIQEAQPGDSRSW